MQHVFYSVLPIFLIALMGSVMRKKWLTSDEFWRSLEKLAFYILFPAALFENISQGEFTTSSILRLVVALAISTILAAAILIFYKDKQAFGNSQFTSIFQGGTRYNNYIFFALSNALFGPEGLAIVSAIAPYMIVLTNIMALMSFIYYVPPEDSSNNRYNNLLLLLKCIFSNPFVVASILGFTFKYFEIVLNSGVADTIHNLAESALTISVLIVGASLKFTIKTEHIMAVAVSSGVKLIALPIITFVILWVMSISNIERSVGILFSCLPCATSSYILSRQLGGDVETMSSIITFSTIFSILSLSILVYILL